MLFTKQIRSTPIWST